MNKKKITAITIHSFAVAHAITAASLAQTLIGDEAALTTLTTMMIYSICHIYGMSVTIKQALKFLGLLGGFYLGTRGAIFLIKWIPGIGNGANAISTAFTTEVIGWAVYYLVSAGKNIDSVTKKDADELIKKGKEYRKENKESERKIKEIISSMSEEDRAHYHQIMEKLKSQDISNQERDDALQELDDIFRKYEETQLGSES